MLIALLFAIIFVPLLFILGIKTGMDQADKKWMQIMKENTDGTQTMVNKLQAKMKEKNDEIVHMKERDKELEGDLVTLNDELCAEHEELDKIKNQLKLSLRKHCTHQDGLVMNDNGKYICPIVYEEQQARNKKFL